MHIASEIFRILSSPSRRAAFIVCACAAKNKPIKSQEPFSQISEKSHTKWTQTKIKIIYMSNEMTARFFRYMNKWYWFLVWAPELRTLVTFSFLKVVCNACRWLLFKYENLIKKCFYRKLEDNRNLRLRDLVQHKIYIFIGWVQTQGLMNKF